MSQSGEINLRKEVRARVNRTVKRLITTYTVEKRPDTAGTRWIVETTEIKMVRRMAGKTLADKERNGNLRRNFNIDNINKWITSRKTAWNRHINRITDDRIVKIARNESPTGHRNPGKSQERDGVIIYA